jgi:hypothetical protein
MSLYHDSDNGDGSRNFKSAKFLYLRFIASFFKKNPLAVPSIIFLLGFFPCINLFGQYPHIDLPDFSIGVCVYVIYVALILWVCLTTNRGHLIIVTLALILLAVVRFAEQTAYALDIHYFLPGFVSDIIFFTSSLGGLTQFSLNDSLLSILSSFGVLLVEMSAIAIIVEKKSTLILKRKINKYQFLSYGIYIWLLFGLGLVALFPAFAVKTNIVSYESQIKYFGITPGRIEVTAMDHISPHFCSLSIALKPSDVTQWESAYVTVSGISSDGTQLFLDTRYISLKEYRFVDFPIMGRSCDGLSKYIITEFKWFKGLNISTEEANLRSKYITYSLNEKHGKYTILSENINSK